MTTANSNHLAGEKSPYLLQHASNPVNWYPWSEEAFAQALELNRPIFLSIGYATCHWCHVMEKESFEDESVAKFLNENFISIKVDREERPDVDEIYMKALHAAGQPGGWPLNMFLTPDKKPIIGGTYFPPLPAHGKPSFYHVLQTISNFWATEPGKVMESAESLYQYLQEKSFRPEYSSVPEKDIIDKTVFALKKYYDKIRGGFLNNGQNKFPPSINILFLLNHYRRDKNEEILKICEHTLREMKQGGIYDQIGGGLCRYSTDHNWLIPHFEKMLYDNALFMRALIEAFRITGDENYKNWTLDIIEYLKRDMTVENAFASAEDADSEGEEGKFYVWSEDEIKSCLTKEGMGENTIASILNFWNVTNKGNFEGHNILHHRDDPSEFAEKIRISPAEFNKSIARAKNILLEARSKRVRPLRDDKILVSWNAMMISSLAQASMAFEDKSILKTAVDAAEFIRSRMMSGDGSLLRRYREGDVRISGQLSDYALFGIACLDLFRATQNSRWMEDALLLASQMLKQFKGNNGAFFNTPSISTDLIVRPGDAHDSVEPSGNSAAARFFFTLSQYGINASENMKITEGILKRFSEEINAFSMNHTFLLTVLEDYYSIPESAAVFRGNKNNESMDEILQWINKNLKEDCAVWMQTDNEKNQGIGILENRHPINGKNTIYICRNGSCESPVHTLEEVRKLIEF